MAFAEGSAAASFWHEAVLTWRPLRRSLNRWPQTQSTEPAFSGAGVGQFSTMGDAQTRITFDFAGSREVHYISAVPKVGDFVSHRRELWIVRKVEQDDVGPLITCELPLPVSVGSGV